MANLDLTVPTEVLDALKRLSNYVTGTEAQGGSTVYNKYQQLLMISVDTPPFGTDPFKEAVLLGGKYSRNGGATIQAAQTLQSVLSGLADVSKSIYTAYSDTETDITKRAAQLQAAITQGLGQLDASLRGGQ